jgi:predicted DNA-binding transcriptional regulator YafY
MKKHDKLAKRLAIILNKLNNAEYLYIDELTKEFGVTKRTIYRDLSERLSCIPIKKSHKGGSNTIKLSL